MELTILKTNSQANNGLKTIKISAKQENKQNKQQKKIKICPSIKPHNKILKRKTKIHKKTKNKSKVKLQKQKKYLLKKP